MATTWADRALARIDGTVFSTAKERRGAFCLELIAVTLGWVWLSKGLAIDEDMPNMSRTDIDRVIDHYIPLARVSRQRSSNTERFDIQQFARQVPPAAGKRRARCKRPIGFIVLLLNECYDIVLTPRYYNRTTRVGKNSAKHQVAFYSISRSDRDRLIDLMFNYFLQHVKDEETKRALDAEMRQSIQNTGKEVRSETRQGKIRIVVKMVD